MPIVEQTIEDKIRELNIRMSSLNQQRREIHQIVETLQSIKQVETMEQLVEGSEVIEKQLSIPIDKGTGKKYSTARRQEVYDAQLIKADAILNV
jgi:hypothetical protein